MAWSSNPTTPTPSKGKRGWYENPIAPPRPGGRGWKNYQLETKASSAGSGTLTATIKQQQVLSARFSGIGQHVDGTSQIVPLTIPFNNKETSQNGTLYSGFSAWQYTTYPYPVAFSGTGFYDAEFPNIDGLRANPILFQYQSPEVQGSDGTLNIAAYQKYLVNALFNSSGRVEAALLSSLDGLYAVIGAGVAPTLTGTGSINASTSQKYTATHNLSGIGTLSFAARMYLLNVAWQFAGTGTLTGAAIAQYLSSAAVSGSGSLSATAQMTLLNIAGPLTSAGSLSGSGYEKYFFAGGLIGNGALSSALRMYQLYITGALTGTGNLSSTTYPQYLFNPVLNSSGALSAIAFSEYFRASGFTGDGTLSAALRLYLLNVAWQFNGVGSLSAAAFESYTRSSALSGDGLLSAAARMYSLNVTWPFTGSGTLSSAAFGSYNRDSSLIGDGVLSAAARMYALNITYPETGDGALTFTTSSKYYLTINFNGSSLFDAWMEPDYDGLHGKLSPDFDELESGEGTLAGGLSQKYIVTWGLNGDGSLSSASRMYALNIGYPETSDGLLSAATMAIIPSPAQYISAGTLAGSPRMYLLNIAVPDGGDGILSSSAIAQYVRSSALSGDGALAANARATLMNSVYAESGDGIFSATAYNTKFTSVSFTGNGNLTSVTRATLMNSAYSDSSNGILSGVLVMQYLSSASLTGSGMVTATAMPKMLFGISYSGTGAISATTLQYYQMAASLPSTGTLSLITLAKTNCNPTFNGNGTVTASTVIQMLSAPYFASTGSVTASARMYLLNIAVPDGGDGTISATAVGQMSSSASLSGSGTMTATGAILVPMSASLSSSGGLSAQLRIFQVTITTNFSSDGLISMASKFPPFAPTTSQTYSSTSFAIPWWCDTVDVVCLGGGGGGQGGNAAYDDGESGYAGSWGVRTMTRGVDFPAANTTIVAYAGGGGSGGAAPSGGPGGAGGSSTASTTSGPTTTGSGGSGGNNMAGSSTGRVPSPTTYTLNGRSYSATSTPAALTDPPTNGNVPGGGGGAGQGNFVGGGAGGAGGYGSVWACFYQKNTAFLPTTSFTGGGSLSATLVPQRSTLSVLGGSGTLSSTTRMYSTNISANLSSNGALSRMVKPAVQGTISIAGDLQTTSYALSSHQVGDLLVMVVSNAASAYSTPPAAGGTVPTWTLVSRYSAGGISTGVFYAVATATNHTTGIWTNTGYFCCGIVVRGQKSGNPFGGTAFSTYNSTGTASGTAPAITLTNSSGSSLLLHSYLTQYASTGGACPAPATGYTRVANHILSSGNYGCLNSKDVTTTDGSVVQSQTASRTVWAMASIEILAP